MPLFVRKRWATLLGYSWVVLLAGLGFMGWAAWSQWKTEGAPAIAARDKLQNMVGTVASAINVTVKQPHKATRQYYAITVNPEDGSEPRELRIAHTTPFEAVNSLVDEKITALFDPSNNGLAYEIVSDDKKVVRYEDTQQHMQAEIAAVQAKPSTDHIGLWFFAAVLTLLGAIGMRAHHMRASIARPEKDLPPYGTNADR